MESSLPTAIITGGANGIGEATARLFSERKYQVAILDTDERGRQVSEEVNGSGGSSAYVKCDVTNEAEVKRSVEALSQKYQRIDSLINVAGVALIKPLEETTWEDYRRIVDINLGGTFLMCKHVAPKMKAKNRGAIVNVGSASAYSGQPFRGIYSATKGAVVSLTRSLAWELAPSNIRVNCISPGLIDTALLHRNIELESKVRGTTPGELEARKKADQAFKALCGS